jgi:hypothetical protein
MADINLRVKAASTADISPLSSLGPGYQLDGVSLVQGDFVLLKDQTNPTQNGLYQITATGSLRDGTAFPFNDYPATLFAVQLGNLNTSSLWICTSKPGGLLGTSPLSFSRLASRLSDAYLTPPNLPSDGTECRAVIQDFHDSLITYDRGADSQEVTIRNGTITVSAVDSGTLIRCMPALGVTVTVQVPASVYSLSGFRFDVANVGVGSVSLLAIAGASFVGPTVDLSVRYRACRVERGLSTNTFTQTQRRVVGGRTILLPAGDYLIGGGGLIWHPSMNLVGDGLGSTTLRAAQNLNGTLDGALITVLARSLDNGDARKSWQPEFRSLTCFGQLDQQLKTISGCFIESGTTDPDYNGDPKDYDASSARFIACGFYAFSGNGVFSGGNRQRFYAEHLRCVGNSGWGLRILGNDPVRLYALLSGPTLIAGALQAPSPAAPPPPSGWPAGG